jgi:hypothetical protein
LSVLKEKYNELVKRRNAADDYFTRTDISIEKQMMWMPKYQELLRDISSTIAALEAELGRKLTENEIWEGF